MNEIPSNEGAGGEQNKPNIPVPPNSTPYSPISSMSNSNVPHPTLASVLTPPPVPPIITPPKSKKAKYFLLFTAILVPLLILGYVLYWNFLPFGFQKTYVLKAGSLDDTSGELYFKGSKNLSSRKKAVDAAGKEYTFREVYGTVSAIFKPEAVLKNAYIKISVTGDNVVIIPPVSDAIKDSGKWDYLWEFALEVPPEFSGSAQSFDGCTEFDGESMLELNDSANLFEDGPFTIFAEWKPENSSEQNQEIIGHYNWEIYQNKDSVIFQVGRMNDQDGIFHTIKHPVDADFFNKKHSLIAIYSPMQSADQEGFIQLFIDGKNAGTKNIGADVIWKDYGELPLSLGWSKHNGRANPYFKGCVYDVRISNQNPFENSTEVVFKSIGVATEIQLTKTAATGTLRTIKIEAHE